MPVRRTLLVGLAFALLHAPVGAQELISTREMLSTPPVEADVRESYGSDPLNFGDLFLPEGAGPHPVVVLVHGGCWLALADLDYMSHMARDLNDSGWAVWSLEFRRIDQEGGAWPGILEDVARGTDHVRRLAERYPVDPATVVTLGHSSGGHLALWLAARPGLPDGAPGAGPDPLEIDGVVGLAPISDLEEYQGRTDRSCGATIVDRLLGGSVTESRDRLALTSPAERLPLGIPQLLITGAEDGIVSTDHVRLYRERATDAGDEVADHEVPGAGHFELVAPWSEPYGDVRRTVEAFLGRVAGVER